MSLEILAQTTTFRGVDNTLLERLCEGCHTKHVVSATTLFAQNDMAQWVFVVRSGKVRTYIHTQQTRELTLGVYQTRAVLGLQAVFAFPAKHTTNAQMLESGEVLCLRADLLRQLARDHVSLANAFLHHLASRQAWLFERVGEVFFANLNSKLARLLLAQTQGWQLPSNTMLAAELGTVPELVSRKLGEFYHMGYIRLEKRRIFVVDRGGLEGLL